MVDQRTLIAARYGVVTAGGNSTTFVTRKVIAIAKRAYLSEEDIARIRAEVRARAAAQPDDPDPDAE
jgi:hypothetical protein